MPGPAASGRARQFVSAGGVVFPRTPDGPEFDGAIAGLKTGQVAS